MAVKGGGIVGLSRREAEKRLNEVGLNRLVKPYEVHFLDIVKEEITEPMILLLLVVGFFYTLWGKLEDALTIFAVIFVLVLVEVWNEYRAKKAIASLSRIAAPKTKVVRDGKIVEVPTENIVPGDALILTPGTRIAADSKLLVAYTIQVDESSLTGESYPVEKEKDDEIYAGTLVVSGEGKAEVIATGKETRIGKISKLAQEIRQPKTPLQLAMKALTKNLVWVALFFSITIPLLGLLRGGEIKQMVLTGLALAFAVIPEELPIIITMVLGLGAYKLSQENFLVKKIKAAEVLGNATVIMTDKTGTITENVMRVAAIFSRYKESRVIQTALETITDISLSPMDQAVLEKAKELGTKPRSNNVLRERSFGNHRKTKTIIRMVGGKIKLFITGAPEEVLGLSRITANQKARVRVQLENEATNGRRVIAVAEKVISVKDKNGPFSQLEKGLDFVGLISLQDPPRKGVGETIETARKAGIRTIMVTGDHPQTALSIARSVGIAAEKTLTGDDLNKISDAKLRQVVREVSVFSRAAPEDKYRLLKALHDNGEIVAVTGDGVNDSLALKGADIGIAMGIKGTDAAKEAADIVLADDNFVTIGRGIFEGRKLFDNLRKGVKYYLSAKTALILVFLLPVLLNLPMPFAPIQIIILELFMDLAASAAFVAEPAERTIYRRPPRDVHKGFIDIDLLKGIGVSGLCLFAAVMLSYWYARGQGLSVVQTQTFAFSAWILGHIILAFVSRSEQEPLYSLGFFSNKVMVGWAIAAVGFLLVSLAVPTITAQFKLATLGLEQIGLVAGISLAAIFWQEILKVVLFVLGNGKRAPSAV